MPPRQRRAGTKEYTITGTSDTRHFDGAAPARIPPADLAAWSRLRHQPGRGPSTHGGIVLPPSATVLAADTQKGIDPLYRLAIELDPQFVNALLSESEFTAPLTPGRKVFMTPLDGFEPDNGTNIASAQDRLPAEGQRTHPVTREILIDRTNPSQTIAHLWLFST